MTLQAFYSARRRDPVFAAAWRDSHFLSAEAERRPAEAEEADEIRIASNNRPLLRRRRMRHVRFDERRKGIFLAHFARNCDLLEAAKAAGVCERTAHNHLQRDSAFAAAFQVALEAGYKRLEAEAVRERLEAHQRLRVATETAEESGDPLALAEEGVEFDRMMKLLARWDRKDHGLGPRRVGHGRQRRWTFEEAIVLLDKKLTNLGLSRGVPPERAG